MSMFYVGAGDQLRLLCLHGDWSHFSSHHSFSHGGKLCTDHKRRAQGPHNYATPSGFCAPWQDCQHMDMSPSPSNSCWSLPTQPGANASTSSLSRETSSSIKQKLQHRFLRGAWISFIEQGEFVQPKRQSRNQHKIPM